jgi:hypothetical protein
VLEAENGWRKYKSVLAANPSNVHFRSVCWSKCKDADLHSHEHPVLDFDLDDGDGGGEDYNDGDDDEEEYETSAWRRKSRRWLALLRVDHYSVLFAQSIFLLEKLVLVRHLHAVLLCAITVPFQPMPLLPSRNSGRLQGRMQGC